MTSDEQILTRALLRALREPGNERICRILDTILRPYFEELPPEDMSWGGKWPTVLFQKHRGKVCRHGAIRAEISVMPGNLRPRL